VCGFATRLRDGTTTLEDVFRPCIDLRHGRVVQVVGGTLDAADATSGGGDGMPADGRGDATVVNYVSDRPAEWYASLYRGDGLRGGHVIKLGDGNDPAAREALAAYPGGLQVGGGITADNALEWLDAGASHVIVTSWLFADGQLSDERLRAVHDAVGRRRLVIDLSCRWRDGAYWVVADRWQTFTDLRVDAATLARLGAWCAEFLVHGVDVEGLQQGIDLELVNLLAEHSPIPTTYAGGATSLDDLRTVTARSDGRVHLTIGSALDIFGGDGVTYQQCVAFNRSLVEPATPD
jgi:phosphoribosylformimino-5-aminoimidazole carboxamide ribotide isomerase